MATRAHLPLLTVEDFLEIDFGSDLKAELDNGVIRMMAGGTAAHARVQRNILRYLGQWLRGTGCSEYGSEMGVKTHWMSLRYPDVSVFCGRDTPDNDKALTFDDPKIIFEVLSPSTAQHDLKVKLDEYQALPSVDAIVFVDHEKMRARLYSRTGLSSWSDSAIEGDARIGLPTLKLSMPLSEVFARH